VGHFTGCSLREPLPMTAWVQAAGCFLLRIHADIINTKEIMQNSIRIQVVERPSSFTEVGFDPIALEEPVAVVAGSYKIPTSAAARQYVSLLQGKLADAPPAAVNPSAVAGGPMSHAPTSKKGAGAQVSHKKNAPKAQNAARVAKRNAEKEKRLGRIREAAEAEESDTRSKQLHQELKAASKKKPASDAELSDRSPQLSDDDSLAESVAGNKSNSSDDGGEGSTTGSGGAKQTQRRGSTDFQGGSNGKTRLSKGSSNKGDNHSGTDLEDWDAGDWGGDEKAQQQMQRHHDKRFGSKEGLGSSGESITKRGTML
jgi:hypothetical protein